MPAATISDLLAAARVLADKRVGGTDAYLTDTEGYRYVNRAVEHLRSELILARGHEFFASEATFSTAAGTASYNLPNDHYETLTVELEWSATDVEGVHAWEWEERPAGRGLSWGQGMPKGYRLIGSTMVFVPTPTSAVAVRHAYVPSYTDGTANTSFDGKIDGWRDFVECEVAARIRKMQQLDASDLLESRNEALERIQRLAQERAAREPMRIVDVNPEGNISRRAWWPNVRA